MEHTKPTFPVYPACEMRTCAACGGAAAGDILPQDPVITIPRQCRSLIMIKRILSCAMLLALAGVTFVASEQDAQARCGRQRCCRQRSSCNRGCGFMNRGYSNCGYSNAGYSNCGGSSGCNSCSTGCGTSTGNGTSMPANQGAYDTNAPTPTPAPPAPVPST